MVLNTDSTPSGMADARGGHEIRGGSKELPAVNIDWVGRRTSLAPVPIEVGDAGKLRERFFVDPLPARARPRFLNKDCKQGLKNHIRRAQLLTVRHNLY